MSLEQSQSSIRDVRGLATKLHGQCRDSASTYKTLAPSLRRLRNALEEIEELPLDTQADWIVAPRFVLHIDSCRSLLEELDLTLQSHRCSTHKWQGVLQQTIVRLLESICTVTEDLSILHESIINPSTTTTNLAHSLPNNVHLNPHTAGIGIPTVTTEESLKSEVIKELEKRDTSSAEAQVSITRRFSWETDDPVSAVEGSAEIITVIPRTAAEILVVRRVTDDSKAFAQVAEEIGETREENTSVERASASYEVSRQVNGEIDDHESGEGAHTLDTSGTKHTAADAACVENIDHPADLPAVTGAEYTIPLPDSPVPAAVDDNLPLSNSSGAAGVENTIPLPDSPDAAAVENAIHLSDSPTSNTDVFENGFEDLETSHECNDYHDLMVKPSDSTVETLSEQQNAVVENRGDVSAAIDAGIAPALEPLATEPTTVHITIVLDPLLNGNDDEVTETNNHDDRAMVDSPADASPEEDLISTSQESQDATDVSSTPVVPEVIASQEPALTVLNQAPADADYRPPAKPDNEPPVGSSVLGSTMEVPEINPASSSSNDRPMSRSSQRQSSPGELYYTPSVGTSSWQSPFSIFDPLSVDIESASNFLLGSRSTTSPTTDGDTSAYTTPIESTPRVAISQSHGVETATSSVEDNTSGNSGKQNTAMNSPSAGLGITVPVDTGSKHDVVSDVSARGRSVASEKVMQPELGRSDSVHGRDAVQNKSFGTESANEQEQSHDVALTKSPASIEACGRNDESSAMNLKSRWLSLRPNSTPVERSTTLTVARSRFSLQQQLRRVTLNMRSRAGEPARVDSKTDLQELNTVNDIQTPIDPDTGTSPPQPKDTPQTDGVMTPVSITVTGFSTPMTSPPTSSCISPLPGNSIPSPPQPSRAPPQVPEMQPSDVEEDSAPQPPPKLYRIVNPSPGYSVSTISEDLYGSSRPASPTAEARIESLPSIKIETIEPENVTSEAIRNENLIHTEQQYFTMQAQSNGDETPTELHNSLATPTKDKSEISRRSVDNPPSSRYFRIELDEPEEKSLTRCQSMSALPRADATVDEEAATSSKPSIEIDNAAQKADVPTSYYNLTDDKVLGTGVSMMSRTSTTRLDYSVDEQRLIRICKYWHKQQWEATELYLRCHSDSVSESGNLQIIRRIRHLQGVCASLRGQWQRALSYFISVLQTPIRRISDLDEGDFAAFYWLGDTYALLNRRTEALLAYSMAAQINSNEGEKAIGQTILLNDEQEVLLSGATPQELKACWDRMMGAVEKTSDSILNRSIMDTSMISTSLQLAARCRRASNAESNTRSRASRLCEFDDFSVHLSEYIGFKITLESFDERGPWPIRYDPYFTAANVARGRLCDQTTNLHTVIATNSSYKIPRNGPIGATRLDCFTCNHLDWLVVALRQCLTFLEMRWDEVANGKGAWFLVRFATKSKNIIAANYFAISIFKQSLHSGYGVEVCVDGVRSARVLNASPDYVNGVHHSCERRLKKLVKDYLTHAYKLWLKDGKKPVSLNMPQPITSSIKEQADDLIVAPELPLRPKAVYG